MNYQEDIMVLMVMTAVLRLLHPCFYTRLLVVKKCQLLISIKYLRVALVWSGYPLDLKFL